jgi:spore coat protein U domain-containing protein, fimbrial subunit CupE1/2/3/6
MRKILIATAAGAALVAGVSANAATATTTFQVTATVLKTCSVSAATLAFGNYTPGSGNVAGTTTVNVNCTKTTPYTVALNAGTTAGTTLAQRLLGSGVNTLQYNLYTTNTYATVWGDGGGATATQAGVGSGLATANALTVFGQLPDNATNQNAVPGAYADTITVTVTY